MTVAELLAAGHQATVLDSLVSGHARRRPAGRRAVVADVRDQDVLGRVLADHLIEAVVYYGGFIAAGESMAQPGRYFANNVGGVICLLNRCWQHGVRRFVFSSSAAVYGDPESLPLTEDAPSAPSTPTASRRSWWRRCCAGTASQCGLRYVSLRYFNAAGATDNAWAKTTARRRTSSRSSFRRPWATPLRAPLRQRLPDPRRHLRPGLRPRVGPGGGPHAGACAAWRQGSGVYNLGNGRGFSNREVIETARRITGQPIEVNEEERRAGDPPVLVASAEKAKAELGWQPKVTALTR